MARHRSLRIAPGRVARSALVVFLTACNANGCDELADPKTDPCEATLIRVSPNPATIPVLATVRLTATVELKQRNDPGLIERCRTENPVLIAWRSLRPEVAEIASYGDQSVDIVGVVADTTRIVATVGGSAAFRHPADTVFLTIARLVPSLRLSAAGLTVVVGQSASVTATVVDQDNRDVTSQSAVTWQSANEAIATVDRTSGRITGVAKGPVAVTATAVVAGATATATLQVTVADPPVEPAASLTITGPSSVRSSESIQLQAVARNASGAIISDPTLTWQSSAPTKGRVTRSEADAHKANVDGLLVGKVTITVTAASGKSASADVDVVPGPLAAVIVTPNDGRVRAGKTVQLTAVARDAMGNTVPGQTFTWSSSATDLANVDDAGLVTTINAGRPTIRAAAVGTNVSGTVDVTVLARRVAYALADMPQAASYTADPATSFNSAGGAITITRQGKGLYRVSFPDQQPLAGETETFMVSGHEPGNGFCKLASWSNGSDNALVADVRCFAFGGAPGDSPFAIALVSDGALGNRFAFAFADQSVSAAYTPTNSFNASAQRPAPPVTVRRTGVGKYVVTFEGNGGGAFDPEGIIVTAVGAGHERCQPASALQESSASILVNCWTGDAVSYGDVPADSRFTMVMADRGRGFAARAGFAFVDDVAVNNAGGSLTLPSFNGYNSTTGPVRAQHVSNGVYDVTFAGLAGGSAGNRFVALVSNMDEDDSAYCSVTNVRVAGTDVVVTVTCWHEEDGVADDDAFYLFVIQ